MPIKLRSLGDRADPAQYPQRSTRSRRPIPVPVNRLCEEARRKIPPGLKSHDWKLEIPDGTLEASIMSNFSIGVDLGGTNLRIAAVDEHGQLLEKITLGTKVVRGKDHVIHEMTGAIQQLAAKHENAGALQGMGVGVPGIIDIKTGMLRESPNLPGWANSNVREEIEERLGTRVILENDANAAALGEKWLGAARDVEDMAMLTLGTGVGGGIVFGGRIFHGMTGMVGGGVSSAWEAFSPFIFEELRQRSMVYAATAPASLTDGHGASAQVEPGGPTKTIITRALLGSDAGLYGAARLPMTGNS